MIELTFCDSSAGSLKFAKSMETGERFRGSFGVIGGTPGERRKVRKPRVWTGKNIEGSPRDVLPLVLALDIGELSGSIDARYDVLTMLYGRYDGVAGQMAENNNAALTRLKQAGNTRQPVRIWVGSCDPAELCGLYYVCDLHRETDAPLSVIFTPELTESGNTITQYRSTGEIPPEVFGDLVMYEKPIGSFLKMFYSDLWRGLVRENAPLRAFINGRVMGVPEDFYDHMLRQNMPDDEFIVAWVIGKTLAQLPGIGDAWLYLRLQAMIRAGELTELAPPTGDHPYSGVLRINR